MHAIRETETYMHVTFEALGAAAVGLGVIVAGLYNGWTAHQARKEAQTAARNSYPLTNGWGSKVTERLDTLVHELARVHTRMDENDRRQSSQDDRMQGIDARASEAAAAARAAAEQSAAVSVGLTTHLHEHTQSDLEVHR